MSMPEWYKREIASIKARVPSAKVNRCRGCEQKLFTNKDGIHYAKQLVPSGDGKFKTQYFPVMVCQTRRHHVS